MKKFILSIILLSFTINSFSQVEKAPMLSRNYYLQKSRNNNTIGWILLGGGTAMIVGGAISNPPRESSPSLSDAFAFNANDIIILVGIGVDLISIPFL
jgi:hypothetical protein